MKKLEFFLLVVVSFALVFGCAKKSADEYYKKGFRHQIKGNYDLAIVEYQKAIQTDSTHTQSYLNLGVCYAEKEMYDEAIESYQKVIRYFPLHTKAYYNLGWVYNLKGEKEKALEQYNQLKSLDPKLAQRLKDAIE